MQIFWKEFFVKFWEWTRRLFKIIELVRTICKFLLEFNQWSIWQVRYEMQQIVIRVYDCLLSCWLPYEGANYCIISKGTQHFLNLNVIDVFMLNNWGSWWVGIGLNMHQIKSQGWCIISLDIHTFVHVQIHPMRLY